MAADRAHWTARYDTPSALAAPSPFVVDALARLPPPLPGARALDVACGRGRHALPLARAGYAVLAVDWALPALQMVRRAARAAALDVTGLVADVTAWPMPRQHYALVLATNFLERTLLPALRAAVARRGVLVLETFLEGHAALGHPTNPAYLLRHGELRALCRDWEIVQAHEGRVTRGSDTAMMAGIVARRP
jgi:2-polyprenyl-3-methyl-5-hydroxy-6-metoxy-1,4-benzoquinol methylase